MAKNRFLVPSQQQQTQTPMSAPHSYTVDLAGANQESLIEEDDSDICPVCDGVCTCHNKANTNSDVLYPSQDFISPNVPPPGSATSSTCPTSSGKVHSPSRFSSMKIKHTLPVVVPSDIFRIKEEPSLILEKRDEKHTPAISALDFYHPTLNPNGPKRRGRPPKALVAAREAAERAAAAQVVQEGGSALNSSSSIGPDFTKRKIIMKTSGGGPKAGPSRPRGRPPRSPPKTLASSQSKKPKKKLPVGRPKKSVGTRLQRRGTNASSYSADREDSTSFADSRSETDDFYDTTSGRFPTFLLASALSSSEDDGDESNLSSSSAFDTDSSMEAEEEQYIREHTKSKARTRKELLDGDDWARKQQRKNWIIQPRQPSVGTSDVEMTVEDDSDATEDDDGVPTNGEEEEEEAEGERNGILLGPRNGYVGLATGWSEEEDEEDSFDADLFFDNLSDSDKGGSDSSSAAGDVDVNQSDLDDAMSVDGGDRPALLPAFEVTEGWDGRLVFTNGIQDHGSHLNFFSWDQPPADTTSPSPSGTTTLDESSAAEEEEDGYEQDDDQIDGEGDTTDEELIGEDNRPNERAMQLFNFPPSISAINPLSTMSPGQSPSPCNRRRPPSAPKSIPQSPRPADILSGTFIPVYDSEDEEGASRPPSAQRSPSSSRVPKKGQFMFDTGHTHTHAVVGPSRRYAHVPSPHARRGRGRGRMSASLGMHDELHQLLRKTLFPRPTSLPAPERDDHSILSVPSTPAGFSSSFDDDEVPIALDDMIDSSFLDAEPNTHSSNHSHPSHEANRWDFINVGAFRQTREPKWTNEGTSGLGSDSSAAGMIKSSPLSTMLWQNREFQGIASSSSSHSKRRLGVLVSPGLFPISERTHSERDGDKTPTLGASHAPANTPTSLPCTPSSKKDSRQERKLKRKNHGPPQNAFHLRDSRRPKAQHHQFHHHSHHPNGKSRGSSGSQKGGFGIPPLAI